MMNQKDLFKKVGLILNELQDQYQFLAQNPQQLNVLELELFLANANFLTEHIQIIRKINNNSPVKEISEHAEINAEEPGQEEQVVKPVIEDQVFELDNEPPTFEFLLNEERSADKIEETFTDEKFEETPVDDVFEEDTTGQEEDEIGPEPFLVPQEDHSAVVPKPSEDHQPTLNERLGSGLTVNKNENSKPAITDLKQAISLNDKLLYIKDLFNGYNLAYAEAIDIINKMPDIETADAFLQSNYAAKNNWATKQATVDQFYDLLKQRFPAK